LAEHQDKFKVGWTHEWEQAWDRIFKNKINKEEENYVTGSKEQTSSANKV